MSKRPMSGQDWRRTMITNTSQGVASRIGYGLGRCVRFCLHDQNPKVRWAKRLALMFLAVYFSADIFNFVGQIFIAVLTFSLILLAFVKGDASIFKDVHVEPHDLDNDDGYRYGLYGYGQYLNGARIDSDEE